MPDRVPARKLICIAGVKRVLALVEELAPETPPNRKKRIVNQILTLLDGQNRAVRMTPALLQDLVSIHSQCPLDQLGKCALTVFSTPLAWEINKALGVADETDKAFRRCSDMTAARPLGPGHSEED
jgi:hypothetical protein